MNQLKKVLEFKGYTVSCFEKAEDAAKYINQQIDGLSVGFGGSMTVKQLGLYEALKTHNTAWSHANVPDGMTAKEVMTNAAVADVYISSVNGLSRTGEIINIDGNCNRVASIMYGHKKVYLVVGINKVADDYESALYRARNIAAPLNAKRLNRKTPCAVNADRCYNCNSPERICRGLTVLWQKPSACDYEVVLINEKLGY